MIRIMKLPNKANRRTVLKITGAGIGGGAVFTGAASAEEDEEEDDDSGPYEGGADLDGFLNEEAVFKETPIWDGEIVDKRGQEVVDVAVGSLTTVQSPPDFPDELPFGFTPRVVKVSPGATVRWTWVSNPYDQPIPHDVTSLVDDEWNVVLEPHAGQRFHHHDQYTPVEDGDDVNPTFEFTFNKRWNHLYYCTPHGAPFEHDGHSENLVGMRGAVKVAGKALRK